MPVKSAKQFRFWEGVKHGSIAGPSKAVADDFLSATPESTKSKFAKQPRTDKFTNAMRKKK